MTAGYFPERIYPGWYFQKNRKGKSPNTDIVHPFLDFALLARVNLVAEQDR
jgi:hypothetical protein